ncbi:hypothetical protein ACOMHN_026205 [Nucella lapillus]
MDLCRACCSWWLCLATVLCAHIHGTSNSAAYGILTSTHTDSPQWRPCLEDFCLCREREANCSGRLRHTTYIPRPPDGITDLDLSHNNFSSEMLTNNYLRLDNNVISHIPDGSFDSLPKLTTLNLDNNRIKLITQNTFGQGLREQVDSITLSFNPLECSCELLWFQHWFQSDPEVFSSPEVEVSDYTCSNLPGVRLKDFYLADQACVLSRDTSLFLIQTSGVVLVSLLLVSVALRYWWHIRLLLYEAFRGGNDLRRQRLEAERFDFDVFVSYCSQDLAWVSERLMPTLEEGLGLRLCVHERDFVPGRHIVDNIVQHVQASKKILMVFSTHFVRSQWCQFELSLCLTHVMDYDDALIVVCVDDVLSHDMTSSMRAVLKTTTYIQWKREVEAEDLFWRRLLLALRDVLPRGADRV